MLKERVEQQIREALRAGDRLQLSVLRMLASAIHNREIEKRTRVGPSGDASLGEEEIIQVVRAELKKRRDAVEAYTQGGRPEAARREEIEGHLLSAFLPDELSDIELEAIVKKGLAVLNVSKEKGFGQLMGWVMGKAEGRASGERVSAAVRRHLNGE